MRYEEIIRLGELFEIQYEGITVRTKLQEIVTSTEFTVLQPTVKGVPLRTEDRDVTFMFYRPNGCYSFNARISSPFRAGNIMLCRVVCLSEIMRIQRRQCYRMPIVLDAFLYEMDEAGEPDERAFKGKTIDLSEKSVALSCFTAFQEDTQLAVEIRLSDTDSVRIRAKVIRIEKPLQPTDPYMIVLIFTDKYEKNRDFLRRYILRQQILLRKKDKTQ